MIILIIIGCLILGLLIILAGMWAIGMALGSIGSVFGSMPRYQDDVGRDDP